MKAKRRVRGLLERKIEDPRFRKRFEDGYDAFRLEVQILSAMEKKGWSYSDLARALNTHKSNVSRDLSAGAIHSATLSRLERIGAVLGLIFLPVFISERQKKAILPRLHRLVSVS